MNILSASRSGSTVEELKGNIEGWDAYSIFPSNGLFYLLMTGTEIEIDIDSFRKDIYTSTQKSMTRYGCSKSRP